MESFSGFFFLLESRRFYIKVVMVRGMSRYTDVKHLKPLAVNVTAKILEYKDIMDHDRIGRNKNFRLRKSYSNPVSTSSQLFEIKHVDEYC